MSSNRTVVRGALVGAFLFAMLLSSIAMADPRNVVLIIADDQGLDLGVYGNPVLRTPSLDRLAASGTVFTNAFATRSRTRS